MLQECQSDPGESTMLGPFCGHKDESILFEFITFMDLRYGSSFYVKVSVLSAVKI
jgi:hypothetical protein